MVKQQSRTKQEPPVQFRPGPMLGQLVLTIAGEHDVGVNETYKALAALAATGMDYRHYGLIAEMAAATGGGNAFVRCCILVRAALEGAGRVRGAPLDLDPDRAAFIQQTVIDFLVEKGLTLRGLGLSFLPPHAPQRAEQPQQERARRGRPIKVRRRIRRLADEPESSDS